MSLLAVEMTGCASDAVDGPRALIESKAFPTLGLHLRWNVGRESVVLGTIPSLQHVDLTATDWSCLAWTQYTITRV